MKDGPMSDQNSATPLEDSEFQSVLLDCLERLERGTSIHRMQLETAHNSPNPQGLTEADLLRSVSSLLH